MPVLKNKTQGNYVNVYKGIVMDHSLSLKDRGMLLTLLSLPDNWEFTVSGLGKILPDGKAAINSSIIKLREMGYLTKEQTRGKKGAFGGNVIEVHETPILPHSENRLPVNQSPADRTTGKPPPVLPPAENQAQLNNKQENIQGSIDQVSDYPSIHQSSINQNRMDPMDVSSDIIRENISYDVLAAEYPHDIAKLDEIVGLLAEVAAVKRKTVRIGGEDYPYELVKSRFLKLEKEHIKQVVENMNRRTGKISNIRNYMLTVLYHAPESSWMDKWKGGSKTE